MTDPTPMDLLTGIFLAAVAIGLLFWCIYCAWRAWDERAARRKDGAR